MITGSNTIYLGDRVFAYDRENHLAFGLPLAVECETVASPDAPLFGMYISVDPVVLRSLASVVGPSSDHPDPEDVAARYAPMTDEMQGALERLMQILCSDEDTAVLARRRCATFSTAPCRVRPVPPCRAC